MADKSPQDKPVSPGARASTLLKTLGSAIRTGHDSDARNELVSLFTLIEKQQKQIAALEARMAALEQGRGAE